MWSQTKRITGLAALALGCIVLQVAYAMPYPTQPIKIVAPAGPGSTSDIIARILAQRLENELKTTIIVENRPGASGTIAAQYVVNSNADGYTFFLGSSGIMTLVPHILPSVKFNSKKDFTPISYLGSMPNVLVVNADSPIKNFDDFKSTAKSKVGGLAYGSTGVGGAGWITMELLRRQADLDVTGVAYRGDAPALADLVGSHIDFVFNPLAGSIGQITAGAVRPLAVSSMHRAPQLPDVPTLHEAGYKQFNVIQWYGLYGPADVEEGVRNTVKAAIASLTKSPEFQQQLSTLGVDLLNNVPENFEQFHSAEADRWEKILFDIGALAVDKK